MSERGSKQVKFIDPPNLLQQKVGKGGIDPLRLKRADEFIDENPVDFTNYATDIMGRLDIIFVDAQEGKVSGKKAVDRITRPIMELKANGGMFKYTLVSEIAGIVLNFMENIDELDDDVYDIIRAHQNTLSIIIDNKLKGSGGREGRALAEELYGACRRYYKKHNIKPRG